MNKNQKVSVVIATLGGNTILRTIGALNNGSIIPEEILICIPIDYISRVNSLPYENIRVIATHCRGQVAQRAIGFQQASFEFVLQLDDDIELRQDCLEKLVIKISEANNTAISPKMMDSNTGNYHYSLVPERFTNSVHSKIMFWIINGKKGYIAGKIGRAGVGMGLPEKPDDWYDLDWLPGGCILHRKENLITYNFYLLTGKAFAEDLFHSVLLRNKNIRLIRCGDAICDVDFSHGISLDSFGVLKGYIAYAIALKNFIKNNTGNIFFLYLYLVFNLYCIVYKYILKKLF
jgi:glycosyltransferase involved in cell wall biosynthesis